uniref:Uncharacterized protein n=1 Tax=Arundo donax TaxID=35708 RepID=A0A0A9FZQ8_ARUDO
MSGAEAGSGGRPTHICIWHRQPGNFQLQARVPVGGGVQPARILRLAGGVAQESMSAAAGPVVTSGGWARVSNIYFPI